MLFNLFSSPKSYTVLIENQTWDLLNQTVYDSKILFILTTTNMKASIFNYFIPYKEKTILFNGLTEAFFIIPEYRTDTYRAILENPEQYEDSFGDFLRKMRTQGFIVKKDTDEHQLVRQKLEMHRTPNQYSSSIVTEPNAVSVKLPLKPIRHVEVCTVFVGKEPVAPEFKMLIG